MVENAPSNAGDLGSISCWGTKIPHAARQLRPHAATSESLGTIMKTQHSQKKIGAEEIPKVNSIDTTLFALEN